MLIDDVVRASVGHEEDNAKDLTTRGMGRGGGEPIVCGSKI